MLNVMRENLKHLKWVLWIVAVSMVLYLGVYFTSDSRQARGVTADWAAKVDGTTISTRQFLDVARRADEYYRKMFGAQYDQIKGQLQLGQQVIQQLVDDQVLLYEARKLGLEASASEVSRQILSDPQFQDASGRFIGKSQYTSAMERMWPGGVAAYEQKIGGDIGIAKWKELVTEPVQVSDSEVLDAYRARANRAALDYVVVPTAKQSVPSKLSDADVRSWYDAHKENYRRGDGRRVRYAVVERQTQLSKVSVTDADVKSFYDANLAQYSRPEQRRARHILFRIEAGASPAEKEQARQQAEAVLARLKKGEDFAALARTLSQDPGSAEKGGDLGFFGRGQMVPAFDKAAFETPIGQISGVTESEFGFHIVQPTETRAAGTAPMSEVAEGIRRQLGLRRAQEMAQSEAKRIRESLASAKDLDAAAGKNGLKVEEKVVTRGDMPPDLAASPEFTDAVFQLAEGAVSQPLAIARGMAIVASLGTVAPMVPPLAEVDGRVRSDFLNSRAREAALAEARRAFAAHPDLAAAAKALGQEVRKSADYASDQSLPGAGRVPELDKIVFAPATKAGDKGVVEAPAGAVIYAVTRRDAFDPAGFDASKAQLRSDLLTQRRSAALQSILDGVRQKHKIEINQEMVDRVKG